LRARLEENLVTYPGVLSDVPENHDQSVKESVTNESEAAMLREAESGEPWRSNSGTGSSEPSAVRRYWTAGLSIRIFEIEQQWLYKLQQLTVSNLYLESIGFLSGMLLRTKIMNKLTKNMNLEQLKF
jgi:hypothetical protein